MNRNEQFSAYCLLFVLFVGTAHAQDAYQAPAAASPATTAPLLPSPTPALNTPVPGPELPTQVITERKLQSSCESDIEYQSNCSPMLGSAIYPSEGFGVTADGWIAPSVAWQPITSGTSAALATIGAEPEFIYKGAILRPDATLTQKSSGTGIPYAFTPYKDSRNAAYRKPEDCLPGAADPNDIQSSSLLGTESLGMAVPIIPIFWGAPPEWAATEDGPKARLGLQVRPGVFYDTGFVDNSTFFPPKIALDGSPQAHNRGQITFVDFDKLPTIPGRGQVDVQSLEFLDLGPSQVYVDAFTPNGNDFAARSAYARFFDSSRSSAFLVGKGATVFGDDASIPISIQSGSLPIGAISATGNTGGETIFTGLPQLRYSRFWMGNTYELTGSIEDQSELSDLDTTPANSKFLNRYPVFAERFRYNPTQYNSVQFASLIRPIVLDDPAFSDHTEVGWGVSGIARWYNSSQTDGLLLGAATGDGIGGYIYGGSFGAIAPTATSILLLHDTAAYAGYQHVWSKTDESHNLSSNFAYGFVNADAPRANDNHLLHQAWANLLWNVTATTAVGFEYQFGSREVGDGRQGDDHRFMFVLQLQPKTKPDPTASKSDYRSPESPKLSDYRL